jgi:hypothetical protein
MSGEVAVALAWVLLAAWFGILIGFSFWYIGNGDE